MAELFGVVASVLGLLPLCRDGLSMIQDIFEAPKTLSLLVGRVELQRDRFDEWRDIWKSEKGEKDIKFEAFAKANPAVAKKIAHQLALLSQVLFDARSLEDHYGIQTTVNLDRDLKDLSRFRLDEGYLTIETQPLFLERCRVNLSFLKRTKYILRGKDTVWSSLIDRLRKYNEVLATYGPEDELENLARAEFELLRKLNRDELLRRTEACTYEAKHSAADSVDRARYHELALASQFSEVVKYERKQKINMFQMRDFRLDPAYVIASSGSSTMALLFDYPVRKEHRVVLIEWSSGHHHQDPARDTRVKTMMLATLKPGSLIFPTCYGMVEDPVTRRFGLVLAPPAHIRSNLPQILPAGAISQKRMPVSLRELLDRRHPSCVNMLDLGTRFRLAKRLVECVHMMHCVGWIHKNIRSNSILFFPAAFTPPRGPPGPAPGFPQPLGYTSPLLVGFGDAHIDDILHDPNRHPSRRHKDLDLDYYQHPDKRWNPLLRYSRSHDIYSLGVVLLEIGLWKPLSAVADVEDEEFERVQKEFMGLTLTLDGMCGTIYADVVRKCLSINTRERTEAEVRELSQFCSEIAVGLSKCWA